MKRINLWAVPISLLIIGSQAMAQSWFGANTDKNINEQPNPKPKVAYIDSSLEEWLIKSVGPLDQQKLYGTWKQVLFGPSSRETLGVYNSNGIKNSYTGRILTLTITAIESSLLPQSVSRQLIIVPSEEIYDGGLVAAANQSNPAAVVGDFFVLGQHSNFKCGFANSRPDHLICKKGSRVIGFERMFVEK